MKSIHLRTVICLALLAFTFAGTRAPAKANAAEPVAGAQSPANDFAGQIMSNGKTGRVGIGTKEPAATLDVYQGEIKIGSTGAACTKALVGTIRFAADQLQICNSQGWRALAASVPPK